MKSISKNLLLLSLVLLLAGAPARPAQAQETTPSGPVYIVVEGDTLSSIALRFSVTVDALMAANNLANADSLFVGDRLVIPGLEGIIGILETATVRYGENLRSLSRTLRIPVAALVELNRLVSPAELHEGASLVVTRGQVATEPYRTLLARGDTLLEIALRAGANPWALAASNGAAGPASVVPGDVMIVSRPGDPSALALPQPITAVELNRLFQGEAGVIRVKSAGTLALSGRLGPYTLHFQPGEDGDIIALQGIHALLDPGMYPMSLTIELANGDEYVYTQYVRVRAQQYIFEYINVDPSFLDPVVSDAENEYVAPIFAAFTTEKMWQGLFQAPSPFENCINSTFGNRRSYNGSAFIYYHAGADFCGGTGVDIFAPAPGTVVFTEELALRGNFTVIDHGLGVFTAYMHQSEILVSVGDEVSTGQVIGLVGNTGRSTGPHLHWEVWVGGVPVDPLDWLVIEYP